MAFDDLGEQLVKNIAHPIRAFRLRAKAFERFFTTKERGKGAGLGLSMVLGVARQSGGTAQITGRSVEGTSIEVRPCRVPDR